MVLPIDDKNTPHHKTWLYLVIIAAYVVIYALTARSGEESFREVMKLYGLVPRRLFDPTWAESAGFPSDGWQTLLTSSFLHGGSLHLILNILALFIFADNVEDRMGPFRFTLFCMLCGLAACTTHALVASTSTVPVASASGAVAGVLGAYMVMYPGARVTLLVPVDKPWFPDFFFPAGIVLGAWFLAHVAFLLIWPDTSSFAGIAWWGNVGGFVFGAALHRFFLCETRMKSAGELEADTYD